MNGRAAGERPSLCSLLSVFERNVYIVLGIL